MSTIEPRVAHSRLSQREKLDLATLIATGVASTVVFLVPFWTTRDLSTARRIAVPPPLAATRPALDATVAIASGPATIEAQPRVATPRRAMIRKASAKLAPAFVQAKVDVKPTQSRLARFFLGDGSERVQPFPLADRRAER